MITVKSKDQFGDEILLNSSKITHAVPSLGGGETVVFFDNDTHISILESFNDFKKRFVQPERKVSFTQDTVSGGEYPDHLPRLLTGNVDKRTVEYKEWAASREVQHHPV